MVVKFVILAFVTVCHAAPYAIFGNNPSAVLRQPLYPGVYSIPHGNSQAYSSASTNDGWNRNFGSAVSSAQNFGNSGSAVAQSNTAGNSASLASASNLRGLGYGSSLSSATSNNGYGSATSSANNSGFGSAVSSAQTRGGLGEYSSAVSGAQNVDGVHASTSQAVQQSRGALQHSGATSFEGPGIQAAYSHAVNNGFY